MSQIIYPEVYYMTKKTKKTLNQINRQLTGIKQETKCVSK